ncbi:threonine-tRNA ligase [Pneumocystis carinii B80]|uniref:threonine--tRNA ligase n=1 Tax=Pneumocystis carinii (strain B80) TaxID=1408658 RepID=A0A0W4ZPP8_PNEC8|nr:threonine-tRNA ligase [Pneumocystis carinii B80]KTW30333.1 threonine-tRNA ligase [Pneumocystis carinii B80]
MLSYIWNSSSYKDIKVILYIKTKFLWINKTTRGLKTQVKRLNISNSDDNQVIGRFDGLFMTSDISPGSIFMLPHGTRIYNRLLEFMRIYSRIYGYEEVRSPMIYKKTLWEKSGHLENYKNEMFQVKGRGTTENDKKGSYCFQDEEYGLKPMNCPGHCLMYSSMERSYRDLPIRYADFGTLHRGLTRLRQFHQDDAHIFCRRSQVFDEISSILNMIKTIYSIFKLFSYEYFLSTRPPKFIGTLEDWEEAEKALKQALDATKQPWSYNDGDGAFYGPKIDLLVADKIGKKHQMATIQLDFQLPLRFQLKYRSPFKDNTDNISKDISVMKTPVIIHRAIFGSIERMMALLLEYTSGRLPFWLSPCQAIIIPVGKNNIEYANDVYYQISGLESDKNTIQSMYKRRFYVDLDLSQKTLAKMVRNALGKAYNFIIIVGNRELETKTVSIRSRDNEKQEIMQPKEVYNMFLKLESSYE